MADTSKIEWTDATVNFWWGCTKVGPGCDHCYAEDLNQFRGTGEWGPCTAVLGEPKRGDECAAEFGQRAGDVDDLCDAILEDGSAEATQ